MSVLTQPEFLLKVIAMFPGNIYCKDIDGRYIYCNDNVARILGLESRHQIVGKTNSELLEKKLSQEADKNDIIVLEQGKELTFEENGLDEHGNPVIYLTRKVPMLDECRRIVGLLGLSMDITKRKEMEMAKSEFIQNISHDLRTPLTGLVTISENYASTLSSDNTLKEIFALMRDSSNELYQFLEKIIESVKLDNYSELSPELTSFSIESIVKRVANLYKPAIVSNSLSLFIHIIENKDIIKKELIGYPDLIERILMNLIGNAVKFTANGSITIAYGLESDNTEQRNSHNLVLMVSDTGIGIPTSQHQAIFERLTRLSPSYKGIYKGYGLGLYVTKKLITLMNGHITVESDGIAGKGSIFTCRIPIELSAEKSAHFGTNSIDIIENQASYRILLADDSRAARRGAKLTLQNKLPNCIITEVGTVQEIITCIESNQYDLIITDLKFSDGDGKTVPQQIRALTTSKNQNIPIVALTGDTRKATEESCITYGMKRVLHKPLTLNVLNRLINDFLPEA